MVIGETSLRRCVSEIETCSDGCLSCVTCVCAPLVLHIARSGAMPTLNATLTTQRETQRVRERERLTDDTSLTFVHFSFLHFYFNFMFSFNFHFLFDAVEYLVQ